MPIGDCLTPSYFISYSRAQKEVALLVRDILACGARSIWYDRDAIALGDLWMEEIRRGISAVDEIVLLLSDESILSPNVAAEVAFARETRKQIRPLAIRQIGVPLPASLGELHYEDVSDAVGQPDLLRERLDAYFGTTDGGNDSDATLRLRGCRRISPPFSLSIASPEGRIAAQSHAARLERLRIDYHPASAMHLNAGLMHCAAGQWDAGLALLRDYARAANNFAGWYFLALHLPRRQPMRGLPLRAVAEAVEAVDRALQLEAHPLAILAAAIIETGGRNMGKSNLQSRMTAFARTLPHSTDPSGEYVRAYWCLKPSFSDLAPFDQSVRALIKEIVT